MTTSIRNSSGLVAASLTLAGFLSAVPIAAWANQVIILPGYEVTQTAGASATFAGNDSATTHNLGPLSHSNTSPAGAPFGVGTGSSSGQVTGTPSPLVSGSLFASMNNATVPPGFETDFVNAASYQATLLYSFEILGPTPTVQYQVNSLAQYATGAGSPGVRYGAVVEMSIEQVDDGGDNIARVLTDISNLHTFDNNVTATPDVTGNLAAGFKGGFDETGTYTFQTFTRYQVDLQFEIDLHVNGFGGSDTFSGSLDPTFAIGAGVANPGDYSLIFSDGIGNTPLAPTGGVPEPAAWATMLAGFGAMGATLRVRRRKASRLA